MKVLSSLLLVSSLSVGPLLATPAAALVEPSLRFSVGEGELSFRCIDNTFSCDNNQGLGAISVPDGTYFGVAVSGAGGTAVGTTSAEGKPELYWTATVTNVTETTLNLLLSVSASDFVGPAGSYRNVAYGSWSGAPAGSSLSLGWYADATNTQGGNSPTDAPGVQIGSFLTSDASSGFEFSHSGETPLPGLFSVTELASLSIAPGEDLTLTDYATFSPTVPEASTWAMMLAGFVSLGYATYRRKSEPRAISA